MNSDIINILTRPLEHEWSVQGLGMMRTYLDETRRLHIWHSHLITNPLVTRLHNHPWNFTSEVIFGRVQQYRYTELCEGMIKQISYTKNEGKPYLRSIAWMRQRILCGEGGGIVGEPEPVYLEEEPMEFYDTGQQYSQQAHEIHNSLPMNNTVTVMTREYLDDVDHANVYFRKGAEFGSAEPRPASRAEILYITREVLHAYQESS